MHTSYNCIQPAVIKILLFPSAKAHWLKKKNHPQFAITTSKTITSSACEFIILYSLFDLSVLITFKGLVVIIIITIKKRVDESSANVMSKKQSY